MSQHIKAALEVYLRRGNNSPGGKGQLGQVLIRHWAADGSSGLVAQWSDGRVVSNLGGADHASQAEQASWKLPWREKRA